MRTYAVALSRGDVDFLAEADVGGILVSFAHDRNGTMLGGVDQAAVMLDSGAFSAWTVGASVDLDAFARYAQRQLARFPDAVVVNLDVIPGTAEKPIVSASAKRKAIDESAANAERLRDYGLPICEVYHLHEPTSVLGAILERLRPGERLAFGGLARQRGGQGFAVKHRFCSAAFAYLRDRFGWDKLPPVHGLGIAPDGPIGGAAFPWASVDCSSWGSVAQYGVGVTRAGKRLGGRSDKRVGNRNLAALYHRRVLDRWKRLDVEYAELWRSRGVRFA